MCFCINIIVFTKNALSTQAHICKYQLPQEQQQLQSIYPMYIWWHHMLCILTHLIHIIPCEQVQCRALQYINVIVNSSMYIVLCGQTTFPIISGGRKPTTTMKMKKSPLVIKDYSMHKLNIVWHIYTIFSYMCVPTWYLSRANCSAHHFLMSGLVKSIHEELPGQHHPSYTLVLSDFFT